MLPRHRSVLSLALVLLLAACGGEQQAPTNNPGAHGSMLDDATQVTQAELASWYDQAQDFLKAIDGASPAKAMAEMQSRPAFAQLDKKVTRALAGYSLRKGMNKLTDDDKANAELLEKYLELAERLMKSQ